MTAPIAPASTGTSTRPYLIRALHDWCTDNGFTPYIAVFVDEHVQVPKEYVKNNEIVLNVGFEATSALKLGNELIEFKARFGGTSREIAVPIDHVIAIYARENGQGMAFPMPTDATTSSDPAEGAEARCADASVARAAPGRQRRYDRTQGHRVDPQPDARLAVARHQRAPCGAATAEPSARAEAPVAEEGEVGAARDLRWQVRTPILRPPACGVRSGRRASVSASGRRRRRCQRQGCRSKTVQVSTDHRRTGGHSAPLNKSVGTGSSERTKK